ncbi:MAG TPA: IclR family transcriptional regulator, partial [Arthrobacter bacterium]|nr:IclR family transcriptional regulator [Arthrobacter sp.]
GEERELGLSSISVPVRNHTERVVAALPIASAVRCPQRTRDVPVPCAAPGRSTSLVRKVGANPERPPAHRS